MPKRVTINHPCPNRELTEGFTGILFRMRFTKQVQEIVAGLRWQYMAGVVFKKMDPGFAWLPGGTNGDIRRDRG